MTANVRVLPHREGILFWVDPDQSNSYAADGLSVYEVRAPVAKATRLAVTLGDTVSIGPGARLAIGAGGNSYAWITKYVVTCDAATRTLHECADTGGTADDRSRLVTGREDPRLCRGSGPRRGRFPRGHDRALVRDPYPVAPSLRNGLRHFCPRVRC